LAFWCRTKPNRNRCSLFFETCNTIFGFFNLISIIFFRVFFVSTLQLQLRLLWLVFLTYFYFV
jgi:hypothetical protein